MFFCFFYSFFPHWNSFFLPLPCNFFSICFSFSLENNVIWPTRAVMSLNHSKIQRQHIQNRTNVKARDGPVCIAKNDSNWLRSWLHFQGDNIASTLLRRRDIASTSISYPPYFVLIDGTQLRFITYSMHTFYRMIIWWIPALKCTYVDIKWMKILLEQCFIHYRRRYITLHLSKYNGRRRKRSNSIIDSSLHFRSI